MATVEEALKAMRIAHERGETEKARRMAHVASQLRQQEQRASGPKFMAQLNAGIADVMDAVDITRVLPGGRAPSAGEAMRMSGIKASDERPEGGIEGFARGAGQAAATLPLLVGGLTGLATRGGVTGGVSSQMLRPLATKTGATAEVIAGGISGGAREYAREQGASPLVQDLAGIAAPLGAGVVANYTPTALVAREAGKFAQRNILPYTKPGATQVAAERVRGLVGGVDEAEAVVGRINPNDNPLNLTPAQQSGNQNLIALEQQAAREDPSFGARLEERTAQSNQIARDGGNIGEDPEGAQTFFSQRLREFRKGLDERVSRVTQMADESLEGVGPRASETANSEQTIRRLKAAYDEESMRESALWRAIPLETEIGTSISTNTADDIYRNLSRTEIEVRDFPEIARRLLLDEDGLGEATSAFELHKLYSELRSVAREAMAGTNQKKNKARIANEIADAILRDLEIAEGTPGLGPQIAEARAFSRALHETFDRGTVGAMLKRTLDGDETMTAESALRRTVGRGGPDAVAADRGISRAAPDARQNIDDYLRGMFVDRVFKPDGTFDAGGAAKWLRNNRELMTRYPELRTEFAKALRSREFATELADRAARRSTAAGQAAGSRFIEGTPEQAVERILSSARPARAARELARQASKDPSGAAISGVKGAFSRNLMTRAAGPDGDTLSGQKWIAYLNKNRAALEAVYSSEEMSFMRTIGRELSKLDRARTTQEGVGPVLEMPVNRIVEMVARIAGAKAATQMGAGGGNAGVSLQAASLGSANAKMLAGRLTNTRARDMLMAALEDPELMKALLLEPPKFSLKTAPGNRLLPYLTGAGASETFNEE